MTNSEEIFDSDVMSSSVNPSVKYSCLVSPVKFSNGSTAMEGLSGSDRVVFSVRKEKIPGEEIVGSINFLTTRFATTGRGATPRVNATFCHCLSRYQAFPIVFPNASGSGRMRYTCTGSVMFVRLCAPRDWYPTPILFFT